MKKLTCVTLLAAMAGMAMAADPVVEFTLHDGDRKVVGTAHWMPVQKQYEVNVKNITSTLTPGQVKGIRVKKPDNWDATMEQVKKGEVTQSVTALNSIMKDYYMLEYDILAADALIRTYLRINRVDDALRVAEDLLFVRPNAASETEAAPQIWAAWVAAKRTSKLDSTLTDAIQKGPRKVAAQALVMRGDTLKAANKEREAMKDGYLRVVLLFKDAREVLPEALYKAALAFDALNEVHYAERMRQMLLKDFSDSEYARRIR